MVERAVSAREPDERNAAAAAAVDDDGEDSVGDGIDGGEEFEVEIEVEVDVEVVEMRKRSREASQRDAKLEVDGGRLGCFLSWNPCAEGKRARLESSTSFQQLLQRQLQRTFPSPFQFPPPTVVAGLDGSN